MSCNGCRVLRKGCSESCILRPCLLWIEGAEAQGHATLFVAKFFGRTGLMNFISSVPESQRPGVFRSLLFEACGRTVNPVDGAVGLLGSGNWHVCQAAVEAVLRGESPLQPSPEPPRRTAESADGRRTRKDEAIGKARMLAASDVNLWLSPAYMRRPETPSEGSVTTSGGGGAEDAGGGSPQLLNLFF